VKQIRFVTGDATAPLGNGPRIIVHVCNDLGKWGKGFVLAVSRRWKEPERIYKASFAGEQPPVLGDVQFVPVATDLVVANLIGQHGIAGRGTKVPPIRYEAIETGLRTVRDRALQHGASVHMPRIGAGLAGGDWSRIEGIVVSTLVDAGVETTVYDFAAS
jgi:O-acetyl-ADP-ribose deacetylase (regulator of RNase III)